MRVLDAAAGGRHLRRLTASVVDVRPATDGDLPAINELYNHYVQHTHVTFDLAPFTMGQRREWFSHYAAAGRHRLLVAVEGNDVLGYTSSSPFRPKEAYETSVETSVYLRPEATGRGLGRLLYHELLGALEREDVHRAYGGIAVPNDASIALHERMGFTRAGYFTEQGRKHGRYWDVVWYERPVGAPAAPQSASAG